MAAVRPPLVHGIYRWVRSRVYWCGCARHTMGPVVVVVYACGCVSMAIHNMHGVCVCVQLG